MTHVQRLAEFVTGASWSDLSGPPEVFEGNKGWRHTVSGEWELDWSREELEAVRGTILKKYNVEIHSQAAIEALLELREEHGWDGADVEEIHVAIFEVAYDIIGGGEEGAKTDVSTKEEADHSLPYILAVAALDGEVMPAQYAPERIRRDDVQSLLRRVRVEPDEQYSALFPERHACRVTVRTRDGRSFEREKRDYEGFHTRPMSRRVPERARRARSDDRAPDRDLIRREPMADRPDPPERAFSFLRLNDRGEKPRSRGLTEIRGPYYTPVGPRYLSDILETVGRYVDIFKFSGGSFSLMPRAAVTELVELCHAHDVRVSTGGFIETVLTRGPEAVDRYLEECRALEFDIVEVSSGFITVPIDDLVRLTAKVQEAGLEAKPEINIQFGAGGASRVEALEEEGVQDPGRAIEEARRHLDVGAYMIMVESEGITEQVRSWRTDVIAEIVRALGTEKVMFEAADPEVYAWYVKNFGPEVNLFVDHSQIVHLECLRSGIWGTKSLWGRVLTYRG